MNKITSIFTILILFFGSSFIPSVTTLSLQKKNQFEMTEVYDTVKKSNSLKIYDIQDGFGITFFLSNEGDDSIFNITIKIEAFGRFIKIQSPNLINLQELKAGQSEEFKIKLFGFGIGNPEEYARIKLNVTAPNINSMERIVLLNLVGKFVKIISVIINDEESFEGYTLFSPLYYFTTYLIDNSGEIVHKWKSNYIQNLQCYLLENGNLIRTGLPRINFYIPGGGITGRIEMFNWEGDLIWEFEYTNRQQCLNHGFEVLPNGNILMIAWEVKKYSEAIDAGRNPLMIPLGVLWPCYIIEVEPIFPEGGNIVWEWHIWDHLIQDYDSSKNNYGVVKNHPELVDINYGLGIGFTDWNHFNSLDYNEEFDQILISSHIQNEIWIIDHSTTTEEAAGHSGGRYGKGGDILYRWGNPQVYRAGSENDQMLFGQHDAQWIKDGFPGEGHITIFNNGLFRSKPPYSSVDEIIPPVDENGSYYLEPGSAYGPKEPIWIFTTDNPPDLYSPTMSSAERLPNGNTIICNANSGIFLEVTPEKEIVWNYKCLYPNFFKQVANINRYPLDYPGLGNFTKINVDINYEDKFMQISDVLNINTNLKNNFFLCYLRNLITVFD
ncbi:MAG: aryl-sulfate sulfotransferase [Thermoplasmatales archaeon]|nr:MAG: aryl-sulfate sulfotransferase [Thermoplasmatales archaeon]